jgi:hypothetical protein
LQNLSFNSYWSASALIKGIELQFFSRQALLIPATAWIASRFYHSRVLGPSIMKLRSFRRWSTDFIDADILCISFIADTRVIDLVSVIIPLQHPTVVVVQVGDINIRRHCYFQVTGDIQPCTLKSFPEITNYYRRKGRREVGRPELRWSDQLSSVGNSPGSARSLSRSGVNIVSAAYMNVLGTHLISLLPSEYVSLIGIIAIIWLSTNTIVFLVYKTLRMCCNVEWMRYDTQQEYAYLNMSSSTSMRFLAVASYNSAHIQKFVSQC